jgi:hypothetical protein
MGFTSQGRMTGKAPVLRSLTYQTSEPLPRHHPGVGASMMSWRRRFAILMISKSPAAFS